jgi:two-component system, cell cycle sensor histidine kinase and response regulator CckA
MTNQDLLVSLLLMGSGGDGGSVSAELILTLSRIGAGDAPDTCFHELDALLAGQGLVQAPPSSDFPHVFTWGSATPRCYSARGPIPGALDEAIRLCVLQIERNAASKRAVIQLKERVKFLSEASFEGIFVHNKGIICDANDELARLLGTSLTNIIGGDLMSRCIAPEDRETVLTRLSQRIEGRYVIRALRWDGSLFLAELSSKELTTSDPPLRIVGVRDVTERERTIALLRESEECLRQLVSTAFDATILTQDGTIVGVSGNTEALGLPAELMLGRPALDFVPPAEVERIRRVFENQEVGAYESAICLPDGSLVPVEVVAVYSRFAGVLTRVAGLRDLRAIKRLEAERYRLEAQIERAQRLDSVGVLAGGIAHDFNNLLVGILGNADLLSQTIQDAADRELLAAILSASRQARELTSRLLAYSGKGSFSPHAPVQVEAIIADILRLHSFERSRGVRVHSDLEQGATVWGDRATLTQVILNLLSNAADACQSGRGLITVRARRSTQPDPRWNHAVGATVGPGDWILIEVEDNGLGMDELTASRIFEPFFSTKAHGHGLGLASCLGIVQAHGGAIHVQTEVGVGSCISLLLPACLAVPSEAPPLAPNVALSEPILIVDDEPLVRRQMRRTLELQGYNTLEAQDGPACLRVLESIRPGLLILDVTMPGMSGFEVARDVRAQGLTFPILMTSGYVEDSLRADFASAHIDAFLSKPYGVDELLAAVATAISRNDRTR